LAKKEAEKNGYGSPMLAYDETDSGFAALKEAFVWDSALIHSAFDDFDRLLESPAQSLPNNKLPTYVCPSCGSRNIVKDAGATWDAATQEWKLSALYDNVDCGECGATQISPNTLFDYTKP